MTNIDIINGQNKILFCKKIILHQLVPNNCILSTLGKKNSNTHYKVRYTHINKLIDKKQPYNDNYKVL